MAGLWLVNMPVDLDVIKSTSDRGIGRKKPMAKATKRDEEIVVQKFRSLSTERKREVIHFLDLLTSGEKGKN